MTTENTPPATPSPKPKKRRRWLKISLITLAIIILLIILAPTLLSTSPGKSLILSQVNGHISGKVHADSISLGWFSPATIQKIQYDDANGKPYITADSVNTGVTIWGYLTGATIPLEHFNVAGARQADKPDVTITIKLVGNADLGKKVLHFTGDSLISATDPKAGTLTKIEIPAGQTASWGDVANDVHAVLSYNLPDIQPLLAGQLPKDAVLEGSYTMPVHIVGALSKDKGLRCLRGFKIDQTKVGEGRIAMEGFDLGKAEVPYHMENGVLTIEPTDIVFKEGGRIRVRGKIDFNADPPAFIIDTPDDPNEPFIKDLALNQKIAGGKLRFFPLFWGSVDQSGNIGQISGKVNVRLDSVYIPLDSAAFKTKGTLKGALSVHDLTTDAPFFNQIGQVIGPIANLGALGQGKNPFQMKGGKIEDVSFALANGKVTYEHLQLGAPFANLTFSGSVGLDNSLALDMQVGAAGVAIPIPVALKGTTSKPELTVSGDIAKNMGKSLEDAGKNIGKTLEQAPNVLDNLLNKKKK